MTNSGRLFNSFGRKIGKRLGQESKNLISNVLLNYQVDLPELMRSTQKLYLEIGSGNGDYVVKYALNNQDTICIGCEPYLNGVANTMKKIIEHNITNIRIWSDDARILLDQLPNSMFDCAYILFPDPWPKKKQHKRRLISKEFIEVLHNKLKPQAQLNIATDHEDYAKWVLAYMLESKVFCWQAKSANDWLTPFEYISTTKYYKKAESKNLLSYFFRFINDKIN